MAWKKGQGLNECESQDSTDPKVQEQEPSEDAWMELYSTGLYQVNEEINNKTEHEWTVATGLKHNKKTLEQS